MSDEGFKLQVSYTTPPVAQYQKGNMLNVRADTVAELAALLDEAKNAPGLAEFFTEPSAVTPPRANETLTEAQAKVTEHLGPQAELATPAQIAYAATKSGKSVEELQGISKEQAKAYIEGTA